MRRVSILGSTGSIGASTIDVIRRHPDRLRAVALAARSRWEPMLEQVRILRPSVAALLDPEAAAALGRAVAQEGFPTRVLGGPGGLEEAAALAEADTVVAAIVGAAGLGPSLAAARAGKRILLANKEALVMAGPLFMEAVRAGGATLLPIDSEHNAIFQALPAGFSGDLAGAGVRRLLLTASGGPFRTASAESLEGVTPEQACAHPNWVMGRKISVDSATLMNKGLEVIEAHWLFGATPAQIQVVIHPQSVIHSLVEYVDGSVIAQLGNPDMRTPIAHALAYPDRVGAGVEPLDLFRVGRLDFEPPDTARFPCLALAYDALRIGGTAPALLNAANEVAVAAFLEGRLSFPGIGRAISGVLERCSAEPVATLDAILDADRAARQSAEALIARL